LIELIQSEDERVALMAVDKVFERAWGKPRDYDSMQKKAQKKPPFDPSLFTTAELSQLQAAITLIAMRQGLLPPEAIEMISDQRKGPKVGSGGRKSRSECEAE
jgi:hypothetical protein